MAAARVLLSQGYVKVKRLFRVMQLVPSWSNARDVKYLAKQMLGKFLESMGQEIQETRTLSIKQVVDCMVEVIKQRRDRCISLGTNGNVSLPLQPPLGGNDSGPALAAPQSAPPPPVSDPAICTPGVRENCDTGAVISTDMDNNNGHGRSHVHPHQSAPNPGMTSGSRDPLIGIQNIDPEINREPEESSDPDADIRENGVTNTEWSQVQSAKLWNGTNESNVMCDLNNSNLI